MCEKDLSSTAVIKREPQISMALSTPEVCCDREAARTLFSTTVFLKCLRELLLKSQPLYRSVLRYYTIIKINCYVPRACTAFVHRGYLFRFFFKSQNVFFGEVLELFK